MKALAPIAAIALLLTGCSVPEERTAAPRPSASPAPTESIASGAYPLGSVTLTGERTELATSLQVPWSVVPTASGSVLVSERDTTLVIELTAAGEAREVGEVPGVVPGGEGGLLGLAVLAEGETEWLYAYTTAADDNRVIRMPLDGAAGSMTMGDAETVFDGIAKAGNHNGGRLAFGPDGMLYITTGDAGDRPSSQDTSSLSGKILRVTPEGEVPADNPLPGSPVWSFGHRNPQGVAWTEDGTMYAAEFGQNTWDEVNRIEPGANYGWPEVEGIAGDSRFVDPIVQWSTDESSPSGMAALGSTLFVAGLGGQRLWMVQDPGGAAEASVVLDDLGRIRDAVAAPDGSLWILTNNTGRGTPRAGDDRLVSLGVVSVG